MKPVLRAAIWGIFLLFMTAGIQGVSAATPNLVRQGKELFFEVLDKLLPAPQIMTIAPRNGAYASPYVQITLTWNQPVDQNSLFAHLHISPDLPAGEKRLLKISWDYRAAPNTTRISFQPHFPENRIVKIRVDPGVKGLYTSKWSTEIFQSSFQTSGSNPPFCDSLQACYQKLTRLLKTVIIR